MNIRHVSQKRLRVLAERAVRYLERHPDSHSTMGRFTQTLLPVARAYVASFSATHAYLVRKGGELLGAHRAILDLNTQIRAWVGALERDIPGFRTGQLHGTLHTPLDLVSDARRIIDMLTERVDELPYGKALAEEMGATLAKAEREWFEGQDALVELQSLQAHTRALGEQLNGELVALRKALRVLLGSSHRDYQQLRISRAIGDDDENVEVVVDAEVTPDHALAPGNGVARGKGAPVVVSEVTAA